MTSLYISPGACSLASHIAVHELGLPIQVEKVALRTPDSPIHAINPLGRVPALQLDDGTLITENSAILPYLADQVPGTPLFAAAGTAERAQIQSWLGYLAAEVHTASFRPLNRPERYSADESAHPGIRAQAVQQLYKAFEHIDTHLQDRQWLVGERFTLADVYLGVFASWLLRIGKPFDQLTAVARVGEQWAARPGVQQALRAEGLL
ncbi:glutathione S-transferase C-terminal domain-containing protein [Pseudomonas sp. Gutcm_11s]|uniref:glutathione S-transferase C-terminal domain-containing protein n=1 Tax=Pseudomonas sp. Gutcm_11s TaxID=3026088 RepID=UPI00235E1BB8|nr:glutathione S-transferase C-terminal domain-containing protein [Pseudomonas sp. Gutcm_11s]MDD0841586.1 glutathione S-transferase N-terminal domain-containing protein [Pseudomonas sp. Gutcm_11s]